MSFYSPRVLLYSAGRSGIGQTTRAMRIADYLASSWNGAGRALVVTGVPGGDRLFRADGVDIIAPSAVVALVAAVRSGRSERQLGLLPTRAADALAAIVDDFSPDVVVTPSHRGIAGELLHLLPAIRHRGRRLVLALRDIYHPPRFQEDYDALCEDDFDAVLLCGPSATRIWAPRGLGEGVLASKVLSVGYLHPTQTPLTPDERPTDEPAPSIVCQVGGGDDGRELLEAVTLATQRLRSRLRTELHLYLLGGPLMSTRDFEALLMLADGTTHVHRWRSLSGPRAAALRPQLMVSMAGYNSCVEAAWSGVTTMLGPRHDDGDLEQEVRAALFDSWFENVHVLRNDDAHSIEELAAQVLTATTPAARPPRLQAPDDMFADPNEVAAVVLGDALKRGMR